ncbi:MAG: cytochrome P450 [Pseudomonadales bacterium]
MDFLDPAIIDDPYPHYQNWRDNHPIWWADDVQAWVLSRYDDVRVVLKDAALFSSNSMGEMDEQAMALPLLTDDPPRHTKLRAIVNKAFTSRTLADMETEVAQLVTTMLDDLEGKKVVDISKEFTTPLPVYIIARLMGIPESRADDFKRWSDALTGTGEATKLEDRMPDILEMAAYFQSLIPERRANPGDDLISKVVHAEVDGGGLSDEDIVGFNILMLIAGNETTTNLLSNLLNHLARHPADWDELRNNPDKIDAAIEEILRYDAPVHWVNRKATSDTEFHGQAVKAGDTVYAVMGSANRDNDHYEDAGTFRLDRGRGDHHSFGHGIHFCIGAPLGRLEARYALQEFFKRYKSVQHVTDASNERTHSTMLRGFHHLWLELEPA